MTQEIINRFNSATDNYEWDEKTESFYARGLDYFYLKKLVPFGRTKYEDFFKEDRPFCKNLGIYTINFLDDCPFMGSRDDYHIWVCLWKDHYKKLAEYIRLLKDQRKTVYNKQGRVIDPYTARCELEKMRVLANRMLLARWKNKQLRKAFKQTQ